MVPEKHGFLKEYLVVFTDINPPKDYHPHLAVRWVNVLKFNQWTHHGKDMGGDHWVHDPIGPLIVGKARQIREIMGFPPVKKGHNAYIDYDLPESKSLFASR
jgi:hypothetical protein